MKPFATLLSLALLCTLAYSQHPSFLPGLNWDQPSFAQRDVARNGIREVEISLFEGKGYRSKLTQSTKFAFDSSGNIVQHIEATPTQTLSVQHYAYNDRGVLNSTTKKDLRWNRTYKTGYRFNSRQEPYQVRSYELLQNRQRLLLDTRQYIYDRDSMLIAVRILENGRLVQLHRYEYDQFGRPVSEWFEEPDGSVIQRVAYSYDEQDRVTHVLTEGISKTEYVYDFDGRGLPKQILWKENGAVKAIVNYAYNPDGTVAKMEQVMSPTSPRPQYLTKVVNYETF